jgi:hypothetical protein
MVENRCHEFVLLTGLGRAIIEDNLKAYMFVSLLLSGIITILGMD